MSTTPPNEAQDRGAPTATAPLAGLHVIELSSFVAAPLAGMSLAQLGAEVIRIDPLGGAADQHRWPLTHDGASLYWAGLNKGKQSMTLDLRSDAGRELVRDLIAACPPRSAVVITNTGGQNWLTHAALHEIQPDLIHVHVHGRADGSAAVDYTVNAETGFPSVTGPTDHAVPVNHVLPAWDIACGLYVATGVAAAARRRELTGEGTTLTVALADVALAMAGNLGLLAEAELGGVERESIGNYLYGSFARDFRSADGHRFMVVALTNRHWRDLLVLTGTRAVVEALEQSLSADFSREGDRFEYRTVLAGLFERWFLRHNADEITAALSATSLLWAPYRSFRETVAHLSRPEGANAIFDVLDQPGVGEHLAPGLPLVPENRPVAARPAPLLDQDTHRILRERLGLTESRIAELRDRGVLAGAQQHP